MTLHNLYGPNAFPPILGDVTIEGNGVTLLRADGSPPFRFFYVAGPTFQQFTMQPGSLTLRNLVLKGGRAQGGHGGDGVGRFAGLDSAKVSPVGGGGGGGMGAGGALFSQGKVLLERVTITDCMAVGGNGGSATTGLDGARSSWNTGGGGGGMSGGPRIGTSAAGNGGHGGTDYLSSTNQARIIGGGGGGMSTQPAQATDPQGVGSGLSAMQSGGSPGTKLGPAPPGPMAAAGFSGSSTSSLTGGRGGYGDGMLSQGLFGGIGGNGLNANPMGNAARGDGGGGGCSVGGGGGGGAGFSGAGGSGANTTGGTAVGGGGGGGGFGAGGGAGSVMTTMAGQGNAMAVGAGGGGGVGGGGGGGVFAGTNLQAGGGGGGFGGGGGGAGYQAGEGGFGGGGGGGGGVGTGTGNVTFPATGFGGGFGSFDGGGGGGMGAGGAIFVHNGRLEINSSTLIQNTAKGGSGGKGIMTSMTVTMTADGAVGSALGGAIFSLNGDVTIAGATLANNKVDQGDDGIFSRNNSGLGGAIYQLEYGDLPAGAPPRNLVVKNSLLVGSSCSNPATTKVAPDVCTLNRLTGDPNSYSPAKHTVESSVITLPPPSGVTDTICQKLTSSTLVMPIGGVGVANLFEAKPGRMGTLIPSAPELNQSNEETCRILQLDQLGAPRPASMCTLGAVEFPVAMPDMGGADLASPDLSSGTVVDQGGSQATGCDMIPGGRSTTAVPLLAGLGASLLVALRLRRQRSRRAVV